MILNRDSKRQRADKYRAVYEQRGWRYSDQHSSIVYYFTSGHRGLGPDDLMENRVGQIVSKRRHQLGKQMYSENEQVLRDNQFQ